MTFCHHLHVIFHFRLYGDYESLAKGYTIDALVDFTGGIAERLDLVALGVDNPFVGEEVLKTMVNASDNKALMVASIRVSRLL